MRALVLPAFAFALGAGFLAVPQAQARFDGIQVQAPSLVEDAACVERRERIVRPGGRVEFRTVRRCGVGPGPGMGPRMGGCRVTRERVERPNGRVIFRTVRRCG